MPLSSKNATKSKHLRQVLHFIHRHGMDGWPHVGPLLQLFQHVETHVHPAGTAPGRWDGKWIENGDFMGFHGEIMGYIYICVNDITDLRGQLGTEKMVRACEVIEKK